MSEKAPSTVIITGAFSPLGLATAMRLANQGWRLGLHCFAADEEKVSQASARLKDAGAAELFVCRADLSQEDGPGKLFSQCTAQFHRVDALVNNAGILLRKPLLETSAHELTEVLAVNARAPLLCMQQALAAGADRIVNVIDSGHNGAWRNHGAYLASKAALASLTRVSARELAPDVQVNGVSPGFISEPEGMEGAHPNLVSRIPMKRKGTPDEVAQVICQLLESPRYLTGQIIAVDGGLTAR